MKINISSITEGLRNNYDKLIALVVLVVLLFSVASLGYRVVHERNEIERADRVSGMEPVKPVEQLDISTVEDGLVMLGNPFQTSEQPKRMMVAEIRVGCPNCGKPVATAAEKCPFCGAVQQEAKGEEDRRLDSDGDGMPDWWEIKYGLNPRDPDDAHMDMDGDGFTNLEEYLWGTDPTDPDSHPPPVIKLRLEAVRQRPVYYRFMSASKIGERHVFTIKDIRTNQDFYRRIGEQVGDYTVVDYEERFAMVDSSVGKVRRDVSILKIEREGRITVLTMNSDKVEGELVARLVFTIDNTTHNVGVDSEIELMGTKYKIVDITSDSVVVKDKSTGEKTKISVGSGPASGAAPKKAEKPF